MQWLTHVKKQEASGLNIKTYCDQASLNYDQFSYWRKKYGIKDRSAVSKCIPLIEERLIYEENSSFD